MIFTSPDDVHAHLGRLLREMVADPGLGARLTAIDTVLEVRLRRPDTTVTVVALADREPTVGLGEAPEGTPAAEVVLTMDADVAHRLWLGRQNVALGIARGSVQARGDVPRVLGLLGLTADVAPRYADMLRAMGRSDLVTEEPAGAAATPPGDGDAGASSDPGGAPEPPAPTEVSPAASA